MLIRPEEARDRQAIDCVTAAAFRDHPHSRQTVVFIIAALRAAGALAVSLVAEVEGQVVRQVAFSPVDMPGARLPWPGGGSSRCCPPASAGASAGPWSTRG